MGTKVNISRLLSKRVRETKANKGSIAGKRQAFRFVWRQGYFEKPRLHGSVK